MTIALPKLTTYAYLQLLDILTTLAFLAAGVQEGNPLVRWAMASLSPVAGLFAIKLMALGFGVYCAVSGRERLLGRANIFFSGLVAWNLVALIVATAAK